MVNLTDRATKLNSVECSFFWLVDFFETIPHSNLFVANIIQKSIQKYPYTTEIWFLLKLPTGNRLFFFRKNVIFIISICFINNFYGVFQHSIKIFDLTFIHHPNVLWKNCSTLFLRFSSCRGGGGGGLLGSFVCCNRACKPSNSRSRRSRKAFVMLTSPIFRPPNYNRIRQLNLNQAVSWSFKYSRPKFLNCAHRTELILISN